MLISSPSSRKWHCGHISHVFTFPPKLKLFLLSRHTRFLVHMPRKRWTNNIAPATQAVQNIILQCHKLHESCGKGGKLKGTPLPHIAKTTRRSSPYHVISGSFLHPSPPPLSSRCGYFFLKFHKHDSADGMKPIIKEQCLPGLLAIFYKNSMLAASRPSCLTC
jgi:hypothetical protein